MLVYDLSLSFPVGSSNEQLTPSKTFVNKSVGPCMAVLPRHITVLGSMFEESIELDHRTCCITRLLKFDYIKPLQQLVEANG